MVHEIVYFQQLLNINLVNSLVEHLTLVSLDMHDNGKNVPSQVKIRGMQKTKTHLTALVYL